MMVGRCSGLIRVSALEREEKAHQQRGYAAQLQEQQAELEQAKARRQQEQREDLKNYECERKVASRQHQPHQDVKASLQASSPKNLNLEAHRPKVESQELEVPMISPVDALNALHIVVSESLAEVSESTTTQNTTSILAASSVSKNHTPLSPAPSIFESFILEFGNGATSSAFYENLTILQKLSTELEAATMLRHLEAQNCYVKPIFLCQEDLPKAAITAMQPYTKTNDDEVSQTEEGTTSMSSNIGSHLYSSKVLFGDRLFLHDKTTISLRGLLPDKTHDKNLLETSAQRVEAEDDEIAATNCLDARSEMLQFSF
ncbi:uncharacterized protein PHALS_02462 [Plasmopara halstedii]|uniref:Uncharacterized protein n=1 Tax=Plasmopara halstedii TaxID=4781 RepID=A0A0P1A7Y4_PLAHL|nr:uncharacterized protein PHALS_02462 [Plasmopara halstedii]CEG36374.1 hypothetical protein PHALS_02462 [Plasmopara halstedii]|eukprot:XP_024572743.1 hypothetical protein PHALS_02462 [Plasmopara halstedii]